MPPKRKPTWLRFVQGYLALLLVLGGLRACFLTTVEPGNVGVRYNNATGLHPVDLDPGYHVEILGLQRVSQLPSKYLFLNYTGERALNIRTKDNNTVTVDISVPLRILPGEAHAVVKAGNHARDAQGRHRFERLASDTTVGVLREHLANLKSSDFYNTPRRLEVAGETLTALNESLEPLRLEAQAVLIRAAYFRDEYEEQLAQIQLNEQNKLLDTARKLVAEKQQALDNYEQRTNAMAAAKEQRWNRKIADLDRTYQVGLIEGADTSAGAVRRALAALSEDEATAMREKAAEALEAKPEQVTDGHLLGIKNIQAETAEYTQRVKAEADGVAARLRTEGAAKVAAVQGQFDTKLNRLLSTPAGRAYVAYGAAEHVKFDDTLTFQSSDGIPSVLRLHDFARTFMGR